MVVHIIHKHKVSIVLYYIYIIINTNITTGSIESANKTFKLRLAALRAEKGLPNHWASLLPELQEVINTTSNSQLPRHITLFEVWFRRKPHWINLNPTILPEDK